VSEIQRKQTVSLLLFSIVSFGLVLARVGLCFPLTPRRRAIAVTTLLVGVVTTPVLAIDPERELGSWIGATSALRYSDRWSLFVQGELRTWETASNLNELLWRVAGHYDFGKKHMGAFGYVRVDTWPYTDVRFRKFYENRFYQEFLIKSKWGKGKVSHRFRLEQRWITTEEFGTEFSNRARYKLGYTYPIGKKTLEPGTSFIAALNEIFVDFDRGDYWFNLEEAEAGLNQNRLMFSGGRQLTRHSSIRVGLMWQHRPKADFIRFVVGYAHNADFRSGGG